MIALIIFKASLVTAVIHMDSMESCEAALKKLNEGRVVEAVCIKGAVIK